MVAGSTAEMKHSSVRNEDQRFLHGRDKINDVERARGSQVFKNNAVSTSTLCNKFNNDSNNFAKK